jgi:hypothetical protein
MNDIDHFIDDLCIWMEWNSDNMKKYGFLIYKYYYRQKLNEFFLFKDGTSSQFTLYDYIYNHEIWDNHKTPFEIVKEKLFLKKIIINEIYHDEQFIFYISMNHGF